MYIRWDEKVTRGDTSEILTVRARGSRIAAHDSRERVGALRAREEAAREAISPRFSSRRERESNKFNTAMHTKDQKVLRACVAPRPTRPFNSTNLMSVLLYVEKISD